MIALSEYMLGIWQRHGMKTCAYCGEAIYQDHDSGYWLHAAFEKVDGRNGLLCAPGDWDLPITERKHSSPA